jgi:uncharacterized membrane-anchored protein YitT (DUF2179 family)
MTIRDVWLGVLSYWNEYVWAISNLDVLDWRISFIILSLALAWLSLAFLGFSIGLVYLLFILLGGLIFHAYVDKKFGNFWSGWVLFGIYLSLFIISFYLIDQLS